MCSAFVFTILNLVLWASLRVDAQQESESPVWEHQTFYFGWPSAGSTSTFDRCGVVELARYPNPSAVSNPTGPYTFTALRAGQAPYRINVGNDDVYSWTVTLNPGGPYPFSMEDSQGASGGVVGGYTLRDRGLSCGVSGETSQTLGFELLTTSRSQCDTMLFRVTGGSPPYKLIVNPAGLTPKRVLYSSATIDYVLDVQSGKHVMFAVEDSSGRGAVGDLFTVGPSGNSACLSQASTVAPGAVQTTYLGITGTVSSSLPTLTTPTSTTDGLLRPSASDTNLSVKSTEPNLSVIIGGTIGALAALTIILVIAYLWHRRKYRHRYPSSGIDLVGDSSYRSLGQATTHMSWAERPYPNEQSRTWQSVPSGGNLTMGVQEGWGVAGNYDHTQSQRRSSFSDNPRHSIYDPEASAAPRQPLVSHRASSSTDSKYSNLVPISPISGPSTHRQSWGFSETQSIDSSYPSLTAPLIPAGNSTKRYPKRTDSSESLLGGGEGRRLPTIPPPRISSLPVPPGAGTSSRQWSSQDPVPDQSSSRTSVGRSGTIATSRAQSPPPLYSPEWERS